MGKWAFIRRLIAYLLLSPLFRLAAEGTCQMEYESACLKKISIHFEERILTEKREFTIYYKETEDTNEVIAECHWLRDGNFACMEEGGFTCDKNLSTNFSILINYKERCLYTGEFQLDVASEETIRCEALPNKIKAPDIHLGDMEREVAEGMCMMDYQSGCLSRMSIQFKDRIVAEKREFTIYYKKTEDKNDDKQLKQLHWKKMYNCVAEVIADCYWQTSGDFYCSETEGFTCDKELKENFNIAINYTRMCLHIGKFQLDVAQEESITCNVSPNHIELKAPESHLNEKKGEEERMNVTGIVTGVTISTIVMIVVLVCILHRRGVFVTLTKKWQVSECLRRHKENQVKELASDLPIEDFETKKFLTNPTAEKSDPTEVDRCSIDGNILRFVKTRFPVEVEINKERPGNDTDCDLRDSYPASASDEDEH